MLEYTVRVATPEDASVIVKFNASMALETEGLVLDSKSLADGVQAVLADPLKGFYLVIETAGRPRACLMITTEWSDWRNGFFWWIQSVYVHSDFRGKGLYKAMNLFLHEQAQQAKDVVGIRLYVEKDNRTAQLVYQKLGMHQTDYLLYEATNI